MRIRLGVRQVVRQERQDFEREGRERQRQGNAADAQSHFRQGRNVTGHDTVKEAAADFLTGNERHGPGLTADDGDIHLGQAAEHDEQRGQHHQGARLAEAREQDDQRDDAAEEYLPDPEHGGVNAAVQQDEAFNSVALGDVQIRQVVDHHEVEHGGDEHPEQVAQARKHHVAQFASGPAHGRHQHDQEDGQAVGEGHDDEHGRVHGGVVGVARHEEAEDRTGTGGEREAPEEGEHAGRFGEIVHAAFHHHPQVDDDHGEEAGVENDVPGKNGFEVVIDHGLEQPVRPTQVQHQHGETAGEQGDGQQAREPRQGFVHLAAEDRGDRGDIKRPRGRHDEEHREHMRRAPHDLVGHAGDPVTVVFHVQGREAADGKEGAENAEQGVETRASTFDLSVVVVCHILPVSIIRNSECRMRN